MQDNVILLTSLHSLFQPLLGTIHIWILKPSQQPYTVPPIPDALVGRGPTNNGNTNYDLAGGCCHGNGKAAKQRLRLFSCQLPFWLYELIGCNILSN